MLKRLIAPLPRDDARWEFGAMTRSEAHLWLTEQIGLPVEERHIGMFDEERCAQVIRTCAAENPSFSEPESLSGDCKPI